MPTDKYDLHTIEYSVQGWDAIMNSDMEKIDAMIPTRIVGTVGETVTAYQALYFNGADGKWYKAQANGTKQPCLGLAVEGGNANVQIRIHRMGEITNTGWNWASVGAPIYLSPTTEGVLTQTKPSSNIQIIGYALSATRMLVAIQPIEQVTINIVTKTGTILSPTSPINVISWRAPFACTLTNVRGYRVGGNGATVNARRNGTLNHLASALSLTSADSWMDGGTVQNGSYSAGDKLEIMLVSIDGTPSQIAVQVDFTL